MLIIFLSFFYPLVAISFNSVLNQFIFILFVFLGEKDHYNINLNDEVVRGSIILNKGELLYPPPPSAVPAPTPPPPAKKEVKAVAVPENPFNNTLKSALACTAGKPFFVK